MKIVVGNNPVVVEEPPYDPELDRLFEQAHRNLTLYPTRKAISLLCELSALSLQVERSLLISRFEGGDFLRRK
jgi:hypothetical protein